MCDTLATRSSTPQQPNAILDIGNNLLALREWKHTPVCIWEKRFLVKIHQFLNSSLATYGDPPPEDLARVSADSCEQLTDKQLGDGLPSQLRKGHHSVLQTRGDRTDSPVQPGCHLQVEMTRHLTPTVLGVCKASLYLARLSEEACPQHFCRNQSNLLSLQAKLPLQNMWGRLGEMALP